jgi:hypothetical protein
MSYRAQGPKIIKRNWWQSPDSDPPPLSGTHWPRNLVVIRDGLYFVFCHCDNISEGKPPNLMEAPFILSQFFRHSSAWPAGSVAFYQACDRVFIIKEGRGREKPLTSQHPRRRGGEERMSLSYTLQSSSCCISSFPSASQSHNRSRE